MNTEERLTKLNYIGYGVGDLGLSISYFIIGFFYLFFLTDFVGLPPYLAGLAILIGKIWDAVTDPLMGYIADNYGTKKRYLLLGAVPNGLFFFLLWVMLPSGSILVKFLYSTFIFSLFSTAYTVVKVPYAGLIPAVTDSYDKRTKLTAYRIFFSLLGSLIGVLFAFLIYSFKDIGSGLFTIAGIITLLIVVTAIIPAYSVKERRVSMNLRKKSIGLRSIFIELFSVLRIKPYLILLVMFFIATIGTLTVVGSLQYYSKYILKNPGLSSFILGIFVLASASAIPFWVHLSKRFEKKNLVFISMLFAIVLLNISEFTSNLYLFLVLVFLTGFFTSTYFVFPYSLVPDLVIYDEWKYGRRRESTFFGFWTLAEKSGAAIAAFLIGLFLSISGYKSGMEIIPARVEITIRLLFGSISSFFILAGIILLLFYPITKKSYNKMLDDLKERKS